MSKNKNYSRKKKFTKKMSSVERKVNMLYKSIERKYHDNGPAAQSIGWTMSLNTLNTVAQGNFDTQRNGDKIYMSSLSLRLMITRGAIPTLVRIIVIYDKQGTTAASNLLVHNGAVLAPISHRVWDFRFNYNVLFDFKIFLDGVTRDDYSFVKKIKINKITQYDASTTTINKGAIKLFVVSEVPDANPATDKPTLQYHSRLYYTDN